MADSSSVLTLRLDSKLKKQLDKLSKATSRTRSFLAAEAIRGYVQLNEWQIDEIRKGIEEADRREFADDKEVERVVSKWTRRAR
jgi:predicted transcriptional regulator